MARKKPKGSDPAVVKKIARQLTRAAAADPAARVGEILADLSGSDDLFYMKDEDILARLESRASRRPDPVRETEEVEVTGRLLRLHRQSESLLRVLACLVTQARSSQEKPAEMCRLIRAAAEDLREEYEEVKDDPNDKDMADMYRQDWQDVLKLATIVETEGPKAGYKFARGLDTANRENIPERVWLYLQHHSGERT